MNKKMIIAVLLMAVGAVVLYLLVIKDYLPDTTFTHAAYWSVVGLGLLLIAYIFKERKSVSWDDDVSDIISDSSIEQRVSRYFSGN